MLSSSTHTPLSVRSSSAGRASHARRLSARESEAQPLTTGSRPPARPRCALLMGPRRLAVLLPLLLLLQTAYKGALGKTQSRNRRGILELAGTIKCSTGRTPLAYLHYGCYCGLGGQGWPQDKVDWCCFKHDCCYSKAEQAGCKPKIQSYNWECEDNAAVCDSLEDKCQKIVCKCDRKAAKCLAEAPYRPVYIFLPDFVCGETHPKCKF